MNSSESININQQSFLLPELVKSVRNLCQPILNPNKVNFFYFVRVYDNGECKILTPVINPIKCLFENKVRITATAPEEVIRENFWFLIPRNEENLKTLQDLKSYFNIGNATDYIDRYNGYYDMYCFGTPAEKMELASSIFLNEKDKLSDFTLRFRREADKLLSLYSENHLTLPQAMRPKMTGISWRTRDPNLEKALIHIEERLFHGLGLSKIAKESGMSKSTLMRKFKTELKTTPYSYIKDRRLEEALKLLESGRHSVSEVAIKIGYENLSAFADAFKSKYNKVPSYFIN